MFIHFMDTIGVERLNGERKSATFTSHIPGIYVMLCVIPFVQFQKNEKAQWRSVTSGKVSDLSLYFY